MYKTLKLQGFQTVEVNGKKTFNDFYVKEKFCKTFFY